MTVIKSTSNRRRGSRTGRRRKWASVGIVVVVVIVVIAAAYTSISTTNLLTNHALLRSIRHDDAKDTSTFSTTTSTTSNNAVTYSSAAAFLAVNTRLLGPDDQQQSSSCGCPETPIDCPRWYNISDIVESAAYHHHDDDDDDSRHLLQQSKTRAMDLCQQNSNTPNPFEVVVTDDTTGGWCLHPDLDCTARECTIRHPHNISFPLPQHHVVAYRRIVTELVRMITTTTDNKSASGEQGAISSISDFGAGVGQYKAKILARYPSFKYAAYDGAGNIEAYTKGQVQYFDLTVPLSLPISDWVVCLEVGEHVPSKYEGMVIRNLHRHNKKGLLLSWSVLGQKGLAHVNNHSPTYILAIFLELGYVLDTNLTERFRTPSSQNYWWFHDSIIVLRRKTKSG